MSAAAVLQRFGQYKLFRFYSLVLFFGPVVIMATLKPPVYDEDFVVFTEQLSFYFTATGVADAGTKKASLLSLLPAAVFGLARDLVQPKKLSDTDVGYDDIVTKLTEHKQPKKSVSVARYEFDGMVKADGEQIADFVARMRRMAADCKFSAEIRCERMRDRFVAGVRDEKILKVLLQADYEELTFDVAVTQAMALERVAADTEELTVETNLALISERRTGNRRPPAQGKMPARMLPRSSPVEDKERTDDWEKRRCFYCHSQTHFVRDCGVKKKKDRDIKSNGAQSENLAGEAGAPAVFPLKH